MTAADATAAEAELDRRLAAAGGGPLAFSVPASALYDAMNDTPGVSLKTLSHRTDGTLTTTLAAPRVEDINKVLLALQARGYRVTRVDVDRTIAADFIRGVAKVDNRLIIVLDIDKVFSVEEKAVLAEAVE